MTTDAGREERRIALNTAALLMAQVAGLAAQAGSVVLIARGMGPSGLGQFSYISLTVLLAWTFVEFGLDTMLVRESAGTAKLHGRILGETIVARLPLAAVAMLALWMAPLPLQGATDETRSALRVASLMLVVSCAGGAFEALVHARERMGTVAGIQLASGALKIAGVAAVLWLNAGIVGLAVILVAIRMVETALYLLAARQLGLGVKEVFSRPASGRDDEGGLAPIPSSTEGPPYPSVALDMRAVGRRLCRALPFAIAGIGGIVQLHGDVFVLGLLLGDFSVGLYRAAKGILDSCRLLPNAAFGALYPAIVRRSSGEVEPGSDSILVQRSLIGVGLVALTGALAASLFASPLIQFMYGPRYAAGAPILQIAIWTLVPLVANTHIAARLFARGQVWYVAGVSAFGAAMTIGLNGLAVPHFGPTGAAYVALGTEIAMLGLYGPVVVQVLKTRLVTIALGGLALAAGLQFILIPAILRRYQEHQSITGQLDGRSASLLSLAICFGLLALLGWAMTVSGSAPSASEREKRS